MSYQLLQFNLGTGKAQGYVLAGRGPHEGTERPIGVREMELLVDRAWEHPLYGRAWRVDAAEAATRLAALLDQIFAIAHYQQQLKAQARELQPSSE